MPYITIQWVAMLDERTCEVCRALNGYMWVFQTGEDTIGDSLVHPTYGEVWNTSIGSQAHGHTGINCRCRIETAVDLSDLKATVEEWRTHLELKMP